VPYGTSFAGNNCKRLAIAQSLSDASLFQRVSFFIEEKQGETLLQHCNGFATLQKTSPVNKQTAAACKQTPFAYRQKS